MFSTKIETLLLYRHDIDLGVFMKILIHLLRTYLIYRDTFFLNWYSGWWIQLGPLGTAATSRPIVPAPGNYDDGEIGGIIDRENRSTWKKPAPVPFVHH
jgi:hypothetical protein